jgi:ABC-2 type transport system ATP-binding protein
MIKVEGLTKRYGPAVAVKGISFEVGKGEIVGFLGPNGAGKTTTMRILTCYLPPTEGSASVAGFDVQQNPLEVKKRIGYLPETPPLYPEMNVRDYLTFVARLKGIPNGDIAARIGAVVERTALGDVRKKLIGKLSKGYRQRVGLAQALIHNPDVLILDEPTSGLDPKQLHEVRALIRGLAGDHTVILSTHILPEVSSTCSRVMIINEGRLEASDTPENLTARLQGHDSVFLDVDGPAEEIEARLAAVPGVVKVGRHNGHAGRSEWEIETQNDPSIRRELARAVVESGWGLFEIRSHGLSLEEIFLRITAAEGEATPESSIAAPVTEENAAVGGSSESESQS